MCKCGGKGCSSVMDCEFVATPRPVPHKHAAVIKAWADGCTIQWRDNERKEWIDIQFGSPVWHGSYEYRVKPTPKPDDVRLAHVKKSQYNQGGIIRFSGHKGPPDTFPVKFIFDGETNKLKAVALVEGDFVK